MDVNTKSKFRRSSSSLSDTEINELLSVVKESAEAVSQAVQNNEELPKTENVIASVQQARPSRKFYAIEKNNGKYDVVEAVETDKGITRSRVVDSHINIAVAIAKLNEHISRLCLIKKEF